MSVHIAVTWSLANLLHPLVMVFYFGNEFSAPGPEHLGPFFQLMLISFLISLPSLLLGLLAGVIISGMNCADSLKWIAWLVFAPLIALLNWLLLSFLLTGYFSGPFEIEIAMPSIIAVILVVVLRTHLFLKALTKDREEKDLLDETKISNHE